jgi:hypothetical protein
MMIRSNVLRARRDVTWGCFDLEAQRSENPFGPKVLPMSPVRTVTYVSGPDLLKMEPRAGLEPATCRLDQQNSKPLTIFSSSGFPVSS